MSPARTVAESSSTTGGLSDPGSGMLTTVTWADAEAAPLEIV